METRTYADLYETIEALCGVSFASVEQPRIRALINRRATKAYRASNYWPRYLTVGQARAASSKIVPFEETNLSSIDTFLMIHQSAPFLAASVPWVHFHVGSTGATIVCGDLAPTSAFVTYKAQHTALYGTNSTDSTTVPKEWFDYIAHGTYADYLRAEGQQEKAALADAEAADLLTDELLRVSEQLPNFLAGTISTNSNMQSR